MITTGVIIAAGAGTRLSDHNQIPKPLRMVCGMPLIKRIILSAAHVGLKKIVIIVGFEKEKIIDYIQSNQWPLDIQFVENLGWKKSNGISVLAAKKVVHENFILMMSDHVFDHQTLKNLSHADLNGLVLRLAVDYKTNQIFDKDDATKVEVRDRKIMAIGKDILHYNSVDTGMFLMSPKVFEALAEVKKQGDCSLSDGVRLLANKGLAGVFDVGDSYWQDVDTPASLKHAEKMLLNSCRKPTDGFVSRHFNRHISIFISSYLVKTKITANTITLLIMIIGTLSGYLASRGTYWTYLFSAILFKLTSILDGVDGEVSKLKFTSSKIGQWLDTICDNLTYVIFIFGTVAGLYRSSYEYIRYLAPLALFGMVMMLVIMFTYTFFSGSGSFLAIQKDLLGGEESSLFVRFCMKLYFVIKRDVFTVIFLVFAMLGKPQWILFAMAVVANIAWIIILKKTFLNRNRKQEI